MYALPETGIVEASSPYENAENRQVTPARAKEMMIDGPASPIASPMMDEDARADDRADAQRGEVEHADRALEPVLGIALRLPDQHPLRALPAFARRSHVRRPAPPVCEQP